MFTKPVYWLVVIAISTLSCQSDSEDRRYSGMTGMTSTEDFFNLLNKGQQLDPGFMDSAMITLDVMSGQSHDAAQLSRAYRDLGWRNNDFGRFGAALIAFDKSLHLAQKEEAVEEAIETNMAIGRLFNRFTDYNRSKYYYEQAEKLISKHGDLKLKLAVYHEIAKNEINFKNFKAAEEIAKKGLGMALNDNSKEKVNLLNALGLSLVRQTEYLEAQKIFEKAIATDSLRGESISGFLYGNLAECHIRQNNYDKALQLLHQDYELSIQDRAYNSAYGAALSLAEVYLDLKKADEALYYYEVADSIRLAHNFEDTSIDPAKIFLQITRLFSNQAFQLKALEKYTSAQEKWIKLKDKENKEQITALININEALNTIENLKVEKERTKRYNIFLALFSLTASITIGLGAYAYFSRTKRVKHNQRLAELEIQSKNQQLTLLEQAKELQEKQIQLQQAESAKKENDLALLRSRTEHQALAKEYYNDLKKKMVDIFLTASQNVGLTHDVISKQLERALLEVNLLETNPFIDKVNQDEQGAEFISKLAKLYPELSSEELKLCTFLKLNMSTKEIADIKSITIAGVNKSRNRIRKKFGLKPEHNLYDFLNQIN